MMKLLKVLMINGIQQKNFSLLNDLSLLILIIRFQYIVVLLNRTNGGKLIPQFNIKDSDVFNSSDQYEIEMN